MHGNEIINDVLFSKRHLLVRVSSSYTFDREFMAIDTAFHMVFRPHFLYDALNKQKGKKHVLQLRILLENRLETQEKLQVACEDHSFT